MTAKTLTIGELAKASATTPRTLRHFEALGLIKPARAENGRRVYTLQTISTLARIFLLKRMGFSLAEIRSLELKPASPKDIIETQLSLLSARMTVLERTISQLRTTHNLISDQLSGSESQIYNGPMDLVAFCLLLREGEAILQRENIQPVFEKYFTAEEQLAWQTQMDRHFPTEDRTSYQVLWERLIVRCEDALARSVSPSAPEAQSLAKDWLELQKPLQKAVGPELWRKTGTMYEDMQNWQTPERQAPFSPEVFSFIREAATLLAGAP